MKDDFRHQGLRRNLLNQLAASNQFDIDVLDAMKRVPRHFFIDKAFEEIAYQDRAIPIGFDQTISQPTTVAFQTSKLKILPKENVLEIGTGSGYQACVLAELGAKVHTIERTYGLYLATKSKIDKMKKWKIRFFYGDGYLGLPNFAPFDKIIITAAASSIPEILIQQLKIGGMMLLPTTAQYGGEMLQIIKTEQSQIKINTLEKFEFVPMLQGLNQVL